MTGHSMPGGPGRRERGVRQAGRLHKEGFARRASASPGFMFGRQHKPWLGAARTHRRGVRSVFVAGVGGYGRGVAAHAHLDERSDAGVDVGAAPAEATAVGHAQGAGGGKGSQSSRHSFTTRSPLHRLCHPLIVPHAHRRTTRRVPWSWNDHKKHPQIHYNAPNPRTLLENPTCPQQPAPDAHATGD